jgi:hypothetical protein
MTPNNSTDILAKLLATENITVRQNPSATTAMFDLKNRVLILPVWQNVSNDLRDMLVVHETGHALDTPSKAWKDAYETIAKKIWGDKATSYQMKTVAGFLNVIEDARIDKKQKRRYPGTRRNYLLGYKELIERDFFGTAKKNINNMSFIDRANIYLKGGYVANQIQFDATERAFLKRIEALETFPETVALTEEIYLYAKQKMEEQLLNMDDLKFELVEGDEDADDDSDWDYIDGESDEDGDEADEDGKGKGKSLRGEGDIEDQDQKNRSARGAGKGDIEDQDQKNRSARGAGKGECAPTSETNDAWEMNSKKIVKDSDADYIYINFPEINMKDAVNDYKVVIKEMNESFEKMHTVRRDPDAVATNYANANAAMTRWRNKEKETISFMVKEFEQRKSAELYSRISIAKTGVIDTNKLHSYKYNDDIFRRLATIPKGKNHGFVMFLDWSGSMNPELSFTIRQLLSLVMFCKQIQVPFEVYTFKDTNSKNPFNPRGKENCIAGNNVVLRNVLSSRMNAADQNRMFTYLWYCAHTETIWSDQLSGTPLNEALMIAPHVINDFRKKSKCEIVNTIVITDGDSNGGQRLVNTTTKPGTSWRYRQEHFYVDPVTKKTYDVHPYNSRSFTEELLKIIKDRTDSNVLGFFLYNGGFARVSRMYSITERQEVASKFWRENKFYPVTTAGYDQYYVVDVAALKQTVNELDIGKAKNNNQIAKAFSAYNAKKTVNRVMLRQFIDRVSKNKDQKKA